MPPSTNYPRLAIPLGDPAGIGTEVVLKALADRRLCSQITAAGHSAEDWIKTLVLIGDRSLLHQTYDRLLAHGAEASLDLAMVHPDRLSLREVPIEGALQAQIQMGVGNAASGEASFRFLETAIDGAVAGEFQGIVTAPIAKSAWKAAGHAYPGQTECLAEKAGVDRFGMLFVARSPHTGWALRTLLATTHIPLHQVPTALTPELLTRKLTLLVECLQREFGILQPRIAVAGLNPHSGEQGQLGREEVDWLTDWLHRMADRFPQVQLDGLIPPDTLWVRPGQAWFGTLPAATHLAHDAYLALYHDQGLIPVKLMAFDRAVNTTIGLPFVRTSPDHGTAFDIAHRSCADASSMIAAIQLAWELVEKQEG